MTLVLTAVLAALAAAVVTALVLRSILQSSAAQSAAQGAAHFERTDQQVRDTFQALAAEALNANRAAFLDLAKTTFAGLQKEASTDLASRQRAIDELVKPVAATLKEVDQRLAQAEREREGAYARLKAEVTSLGDATRTLSRALGTPAVRGRWGEMQLKRVVEIAGMLEHCDFEEQAGLTSERGRQRPDLIVHLPAGKRIVVDAKAPLGAFLEAQESLDDATRLIRLTAHARQVRDHIDGLAGKAYWEALDDSVEMVVLFLPGETLFAAALQHDLTLIEYGLQQRVLLASPITLIALLTTVAHSWRQEALAANYREVARLGKEFYDRLATFTGHFDDVRKRLDGAVQAYNAAAGSLESRVLPTARKLRELEVTTGGEIAPVESIDTVPRVLKQANLLGLPEEALVAAEEDTAPVK
jgi:DNA recombination protein RmuC